MLDRPSWIRLTFGALQMYGNPRIDLECVDRAAQLGEAQCVESGVGPGINGGPATLRNEAIESRKLRLSGFETAIAPREQLQAPARRCER